MTNSTAAELLQMSWWFGLTNCFNDKGLRIGARPLWLAPVPVCPGLIADLSTVPGADRPMIISLASADQQSRLISARISRSRGK